jgi:hypothetical protein
VRQNAKPQKNTGNRTPPAKTYRFDARMNEVQKLIIQRAADLEGRTMTISSWTAQDWLQNG